METLNTIGAIMETLEKANETKKALEVFEDFHDSITAPEGNFLIASQNHFIRSIKQDTKQMPRPLKKFLNEHDSKMNLEQATGMHRYLQGRKEETKDFLDFLSSSAEGEVIRSKLNLRKDPKIHVHDPKTLARKYWLSHQLWRMTPQARRACAGLSEKVERDLRKKERLPVIDDPPIKDYNPAREKFTDREEREIMKSLPLIFKAVKLSRK